MKIFWGAALLLLAASASAKDKVIALSEQDAAAVRGKTVAVTLHNRPSFSAGTAGKASFGLFGAGAMITAGNKLVDENGVEDPAILLRAQIAALLRDNYGANVLDVDATATEAKKPKDIAAIHPQADYVLDVRSGGWMFFYYPTDWNNYWVGYSVQSQLIDAKTARQVSNMACNANTQQSPIRPSRDQLIGDGAQLLKEVTQHLGWTCMQLLAKEQFRVAPDRVPTIPAEYQNPLARLAPSAAQPAPVVAIEPADATQGQPGVAPTDSGTGKEEDTDTQAPAPQAETTAPAVSTP